MYRTLIIIISLSSAAGLARSQDILSFPSKDMTLVHAKISGGNPVGGVRIYLSVPGKSFEFKSAVSDSSGNVDFLLQHSGNEREMVLQTNAADSRKYTIEPGNPLTTVFPAKLPAQNMLNASDTLPFYGSGDKIYLLDDYVRFATLEEILIEYVHEVKLKKLKGDFYFEVLNTPYNQFFTEAPLVLIDGVPVFDLNKFMSLNPLAIRKLEVIARKYYLGSLVCYGIVSFTSYDGGLAGYGLPSTALVLEHRQAVK